MLNIVSVAIGLVTLVLGLVAFMPLLGWMNWLVIPFDDDIAPIAARCRRRTAVATSISC